MPDQIRHTMPFSLNIKALPRAVALLIVSIAVARIVVTYRQVTQTVDEASHIDCGMQLLQDHVYDIEVKHGPLARVLVALGPYLAGIRRVPSGPRVDELDTYAEGNAILGAHDDYWRNLTLARLGTLPFFLLACAVVWLWSAHLFGEWAAVFSVFAFTLLPPVLAHAGLATTDMAAAATLIAALYCLTLWIEKPGWWSAGRLGLATGFAIVTKLSAALFLPGAGTVLFLLCFSTGANPFRKSSFGRIARDLLVALGAMYLAMAAGYLFTSYPIQASPSHDAFDRFFGKVPVMQEAFHKLLETPVPAGQIPGGLRDLAMDNRGGHTAFLLGEWRHRGRWWFFPVLLVTKTPLPFLLLSGIGTVFLVLAFSKKRDWRRIALIFLPAAVLALAMPSNINIGLRHVLAIYPFLAVVSGYAAWELWASLQRPSFSRALLAAMLVCLIGSSVAAQPDFLAYFNGLAWGHGERIALDSDLDWGQDLARLSKWLGARGVEDVALSYFGRAELSSAGLPRFHELAPNQPVEGWVAISAYNRALPSPFVVRRFPGMAAYYSIPWNFERLKPEPGPFAWLLAYQPVARIGQSIFVYHIGQ
jgi:Dolichyl-phosphate-mannose-protein mannosyltransferase